MASRSAQFLISLALLAVYFVLLQMPTGDAAKLNRVRYNADSNPDGKQWDTNFPYFLSMMSNGNAATPSLWVVPVIMASCVMLFIRGTMN